MTPEDPGYAPMTLDQAWRRSLAEHPGLARLDAGMLLLHVLGRNPHERAWLLSHGNDPLPATTLQQFETLCAQRRDQVPLAYLLGRTEFYGLPLLITNHVLDPRDDTETLVDWALSLMPDDATLEVIDLGTGSGAIALALQHQRPRARVWAVDQSPEALAVARQNGEALGLPVHWLAGNWLTSIPAAQRFALIVSNPPYIPARMDWTSTGCSRANGLRGSKLAAACSPSLVTVRRKPSRSCSPLPAGRGWRRTAIWTGGRVSSRRGERLDSPRDSAADNAHDSRPCDH